jgi:hypothetical protein
LPLEARQKGAPKVTVTSDVPGVRVLRIRPAGGTVEVDLAIESKHSGEGRYRVRVERDSMIVEGEGDIVVGRLDPVHIEMQSVTGVPISSEIPLVEDLWRSRHFRASLEPAMVCLSLSCSKGVAEAGAKALPFKVVFTAKQARPVESTLVVDFGDFEVAALIRGAVGGFAGRQWANRRHGEKPG